MAAEVFYAFAHASQAVALALDFVGAIVFDDEAALVAFGNEAQAAGGARRPNDLRLSDAWPGACSSRTC